MRNNNIKKVFALALLFTASSAFAAVTKPGAPLNVVATAGDQSATVTFSPPTSNGGATITSYTVSCSPACTPKSGAASPITVTGLTAGTAYTFTVTATNSAGTGPASAQSNSVTVFECITQVSGQVVGWIRSLEVYSYKVHESSSAGFCEAALGCDGYIGVEVKSCSNLTGTSQFGVVFSGPAHDNTMVNLVYYLKDRGKRVSFWTYGAPVQGYLKIGGMFIVN